MSFELNNTFDLSIEEGCDETLLFVIHVSFCSRFEGLIYVSYNIVLRTLV